MTRHSTMPGGILTATTRRAVRAGAVGALVSTAGIGGGSALAATTPTAAAGTVAVRGTGVTPAHLGVSGAGGALVGLTALASRSARRGRLARGAAPRR